MTESTTEVSADSSTGRRRRGLHPTGLAVAVVGLVLTFTAFALVFLAMDDREDEALARSADRVAEQLDSDLGEVDRLISGVQGGVLATEGADQDALERVMGTRVEDSDIMEAAGVLIAEEDDVVEVFVETGESYFLSSDVAEEGAEELTELVAALANAPTDKLEVIAAERDGDRLRVGLATKVPTDTEEYVIYIELAVRDALFADLTEGLPGQPDFALYLTSTASDEALLLATTDQLPLAGGTTNRPLTIGEQEVLLVVDPTEGLLTRYAELVPLFALLGGLLLTAVLTPLVNRLATRREEVRVLSAQRDELDHALAVSRQIERELRASEQRFRSVLHSSPDVILWMDLDGDAVQVLNRDQLVGHELPEAASSDFLIDLVHPDDRVDAERGFRRMRTAEPGSITEFECRVGREDGEWEWLRIRGGRVTRTEGEDAYILAALTNVTEQKKEEARRAHLEQQLVQSQRLEAVGQLAGGVAHDFNNILAAILSGAELVVDEVDGEAREDVEEIRRTARRGSDLARQLLLFSRRDRGSSPRVVDLNEVVADVETMLKRTLDESVRLETELADQLDPVHIDPTQVERLLMNLTINARDAMPEGGRVRVSSRNVEVDAEMAGRWAGLEAGSYVELRVADNGTGMAEEVRQRCFEPFFSTKQVGKGTGLGLATVYGIMQGAQGHIEVDSELGRGTTFSMLFPKSRLQAPSDDDDDGDDPLAGGTERILVVVDEKPVREATRRLLEKRGYKILVAEDGPAAGALAATNEFDLLLTDVVMPGGMNGRDVAQVLRKWQPDLAVLYMTGHSEDVLADVGIDDDEDEALIVRKPFTEEELLRAVRVALSSVMEPTG